MGTTPGELPCRRAIRGLHRLEALVSSPGSPWYSADLLPGSRSQERHMKLCTLRREESLKWSRLQNYFRFFHWYRVAQQALQLSKRHSSFRTRLGLESRPCSRACLPARRSSRLGLLLLLHFSPHKRKVVSHVSC